MSRIAIWSLILIMLSCSWVCALELRSGDVVSVPEGELIDDDLVAAASTVLIEGWVNGDVFAVGQSVRIVGPVQGSVMAIAQNVEISGNVAGSVRVAGQQVELSAKVARNAAAAGQTVRLTGESRVGRDLHAAGEEVELEGEVGRLASLVAGTATIGGVIGEELYVEAENVSLGPSARVVGSLTYRSKRPAEIAAGAQIGGETRHLAPRRPREEPKRPSPAFWAALWAGVFFLVVFVSGVIGTAAAPRVFVGAADAMADRPWWNLLLGILMVIILPGATLVVCLTLVGLPLGILTYVAWGAAILLSGVPVGMFLGRALVGGRHPGRVSPYVGLFLGLVLLTLVGLVPYVGWLTKVLTVLFGMGVYARAIKGALVEMRRYPA